MKRLPRIHFVILFLALSSTCLSAATIVSTYDGTQQDGSKLDADQSSGKALAFTMPSGGATYVLDDITLRLYIPGDVSLTDISLSLWSNGASNSPGTELLTFTNPTFTSGATASFTFTPDSTFYLEPSTSYWVAVQNVTSADVYWRASASGNYFDSSIGATSGAGAHTGYYGNGSPSEWTLTSSLINSYTINATVVPESSTYACILGVLVGLLAACRRKRK